MLMLARKPDTNIQCWLEGQRRGRRADIKPVLVYRLVITGNDIEKKSGQRLVFAGKACNCSGRGP